MCSRAWPAGQAALGTHACSCCLCKALVPHTLEADTPPSRLEHLYLWRWGGGGCSGPSSCSCCSHTDGDTHKAPLRSLRRGLCYLARLLPKYTHRVLIYSTCSGHDSWGPRHHRAGNGSTVCFSHQISSAVYRRSFFSLSINVICDLLNKYTHK